MKYCFHCGHELPDNAVFCDRCGVQQVAITRKSLVKAIAVAFAAIVVLGGVAAWGYYYGRPLWQYGQAEQLESAGAFQDASAAFAALGEFKDAPQRSQGAIYLYAEALFASGDYENAEEEFKSVSQYADAAGRVDDCEFQLAVALAENERYAEAAEKMGQLGDYPEAAEKNAEYLSYLDGNSPGNLVNTGFVAKGGDWLYFTNTDDDYTLYKERMNGSERTKLNDECSFCINVVGDWVYYYTSETRGLSVYKAFVKMRTDGTSRTVVIPEAITDDFYNQPVVVSGGWVYYVSSDKTLWRYGINGQGLKRIVNDISVYSMNVVDGWVYFMKESDGSAFLCKARVDGTDYTQLYEGDLRKAFIIVDNGWIYFSDYTYLYKIQVDGTGLESLEYGLITAANIDNGWLYFSNADRGKLYKMRTDGTELTELTRAYAYKIGVVGDWIYYIDGLGDTGHLLSYKKIRTDGTEKSEFIPFAGQD